MPVPHQRGLFKSILQVSWYRFRHPPSRGLEFLIESQHQKKYENNLHIVNTNILFQNRHKRCINVITMFNMSKCLNKRKLQLEHSNEQKFFSSQGLLLQMVPPVGMVEALSLAILGEFHSSFLNQILDLIFQSPTILCSMPRAVRMISAVSVGVIP